MIRKSFFYKKLFSGFVGECIRAGIQKNYGRYEKMEREKFSSRLGFILISAGCAIGLGNVWRFPYIVGKYGGAAFVLIYLAFLLVPGTSYCSDGVCCRPGQQKERGSIL